MSPGHLPNLMGERESDRTVLHFHFRNLHQHLSPRAVFLTDCTILFRTFNRHRAAVSKLTEMRGCQTRARMTTYINLGH